MIVEEGKYDEFDDEKAFTRRCQGFLAFSSFVVLFTVFCLIIWGAARPYKAEVSVKVCQITSLIRPGPFGLPSYY